MLFNSIDFFIFFIIVLLVLYAIPAKFRQVWLLICSYFFYMCWNPVYIVLIVGSTLITYLCGYGIGRTDNIGRRKLLLALCVISNLGILFTFKYLNFALETIAQISHHGFSALNIILPVGISFYTFQALGYTIDCYRGDIEPERNFIRYALFVSFFPQLVAGPIERSGNLLGQLGDLSMSLIKREHGVKDYSHLFLTHGGMLDRFDSTLFIAPVVYFFVAQGII